MRDAGLEEADEGVRVGGGNINNLRYADDITLLATNKEDKQNLIIKVQTTSKILYLNMDKTNIMSTATLDFFIIGNNHVEVVDKLIFLGSVIESDGDCKMEMMRRLALGRAAMIKYGNMENSQYPLKQHWLGRSSFRLPCMGARLGL